jgi:hypothetical protein
MGARGDPLVTTRGNYYKRAFIEFDSSYIRLKILLCEII